MIITIVSNMSGSVEHKILKWAILKVIHVECS